MSTWCPIEYPNSFNQLLSDFRDNYPSKIGFLKFLNNLPLIDTKLLQHHLYYSLPLLLNSQPRRSSFAFIFARVVPVVSIDRGSHTVRGTVRPSAPRKLPAQLSIWIFIALKSDVLEKVAFQFGRSSPGLRLAIRAIADASRPKTC